MTLRVYPPKNPGDTLILIESEDGEFSQQFTYRELVKHIERCIRARRICEELMLHVEDADDA